MPRETFFNLDDDKQSKIFDAAVKEFTEHPLHKARVSHIIREAEIPRGSFYQYFEDLDDLYYHIIDSVFATIFEEGRQLANRTDDLFDYVMRSFIIDLDNYMNDERHRFIMNVLKSIGSNNEYLEHHNTLRREYIMSIMDKMDLSNFIDLTTDDKVQLYEFIQNIKRIVIQKSLMMNMSRDRAIELLQWHINILQHGLLEVGERL
ncbi:TetR/AcrR family transcriptional regulator [Candidatus Xianfuyuplasma coldseepsis]|uniref:TetR/AcrR family transcriptional regulator n=1 Tax=Candidatus Xianfuyuplasma coldseepsis TaxID=2782163 RepID=A0A7L7KVF9_9MOLU|nr:TetR/AcrR family transcriptional regulator [Xianfuyuplasma coldseepsis]QMS85964.1 TetR/AcrR family transcriptional regulator [Xianfuyuplasma coldseepsis]